MPKIRTGSARGDGAGALLPALRERIARHTLPPGAKLLEPGDSGGGYGDPFRRDALQVPKRTLAKYQAYQ